MRFFVSAVYLHWDNETTFAHFLQNAESSRKSSPSPGASLNDVSNRTFAGVAAVAGGDDLLQLRAEKRDLQARLNAYEKDFLRQKGRKIKCHDDIRPVLEQWNRYKQGCLVEKSYFPFFLLFINIYYLVRK